MNKFWNKDLHKLSPYTPGEQPKDKSYIKLNTNESPYPPSPLVFEAISKNNTADLRLYPDPEVSELRKIIAQQQGLTPDQVFIGNGSDEILAFCFMAFFNVNDTVIFPDISYSFYTVYANLFRLQIITPALNSQFQINPSDYFQNQAGVIIANPNAPTGIGLSLNAIESIVQNNPDQIVIIDEAYIDFSEAGVESAIQLINKYPNLLVVHTFSKSRSLAGLRVGFAMGNSELIEALNRIKNSFNSYTINRLSLVAACASYQDIAYFKTYTKLIVDTRKRFVDKLEAMGYDVLPSSANFVFAKHPQLSGSHCSQILKEKGILVRHFNKDRIADYLRITIGTDKEMDQLADCLKTNLMELNS